MRGARNTIITELLIAVTTSSMNSLIIVYWWYSTLEIHNSRWATIDNISQRRLLPLILGQSLWCICTISNKAHSGVRIVLKLTAMIAKLSDYGIYLAQEQSAVRVAVKPRPQIPLRVALSRPLQPFSQRWSRTGRTAVTPILLAMPSWFFDRRTYLNQNGYMCNCFLFYFRSTYHTEELRRDKYTTENIIISSPEDIIAIHS